MKVSEIMTQPVVAIDENSTILEAAKKMSEGNIGSLIVTRKGEEIGIITEKDIISKVAMKYDLEHNKVKSITSSPLITVEKNVDGEDAVKKMAKYNVNRLAVVDDENIVGIFSTGDIIKLGQ